MRDDRRCQRPDPARTMPPYRYEEISYVYYRWVDCNERTRSNPGWQSTYSCDLCARPVGGIYVHAQAGSLSSGRWFHPACWQAVFDKLFSDYARRLLSNTRTRSAERR